MTTTTHDTQVTYDAVASEYAEEFRDEMDRKPFDREMLMRLAGYVNGRGAICDMGCGPGQIARYLHAQGVNACGIDLSTEMVKRAQRLNPAIPFQQGNMLDLANVADNTFGGIAAFYSIIHIPRPEVVRALGELRRVLQPDGTLLVTFHIGDETVHRDEWWGKTISVDFAFFQPEEMVRYLEQAGYDRIETLVREPYAPEIEYQSRRAYIFARKPAFASTEIN